MAGVVTPAVGDLLADRYSLAAHINDDSSGRQVWRGMDVLLNRQVTVVLRSPGGDEATEMLSAAVAASRVNHPNIVGVYDAVDQGDCAYVVREWVEGQSFRDALAAAAMPIDSSIDIIQCVSQAVAAVHESGVAHGNIHPGTILLSTDDRVVLADPRADATATQVGDVRALGATLYYALTGGWPRTVPGPSSLPDAEQTSDGVPLPVEEVRPEASHRLSRLVNDLLSTQQAPPTAAQLADELSYVARGPNTGALALVTPDEEDAEPVLPAHQAKRRLVIGAGALVALAVMGLVAALVLIPADSDDNTSANGNKGGDSDSKSGSPQELDIKTSAVDVLDPDAQDKTVINDLDKVTDGDNSSNWHTEQYNSQDWGSYKHGVGLIIDLGKERQVAQVQIDMPATGNKVGLYNGSPDLKGEPDLGDLGVIADPATNEQDNLNLTANVDAPKTQHLLVWCSVPAGVDGGYQWSVNEIKVFAQ